MNRYILNVLQCLPCSKQPWLWRFWTHLAPFTIHSSFTALSVISLDVVIFPNRGDRVEKFQYHDKNDQFWNCFDSIPWPCSGSRHHSTPMFRIAYVYTYRLHIKELKLSLNITILIFWMNHCDWVSFDVCESVTRCVTSDGVSGCLISGVPGWVPPSAW